MPLIKEAPPKRRLQKTSGDAIVQMFEGGGGSPGGSPSNKVNVNNNQQPTTSTNFIPVPPPRRSNNNNNNNITTEEEATTKTTTTQQESGEEQQQTTTETTTSTMQQTDTLSSEFKLFELVLNSPSTGIVTREHAAHRAMLERQLSQRILDARLDERFVRQTIEESRQQTLDAAQVAFQFHSAAIRDIMFPQNRPVFVELEQHEKLKGENEQLRDKIDLMERQLVAKGQGINYLTSTLRFAPPPPYFEKIEKEEEKFRTELISLSDALLACFISLYPPPSMSKQAQIARRQYNYNKATQQMQQTQQQILPLEQRIKNLQEIDEVKGRERIEQEQQQEFQSDIEPKASCQLQELLTQLNSEKEKFRLYFEFLSIEAAEESARKSFTETVLDFTSDFIKQMMRELVIKTDLSRKTRNALTEQHHQAMRHKKERAMNLPPVSTRVAPRISSLPTRVEDIATVKQHLLNSAVGDVKKHVQQQQKQQQQQHASSSSSFSSNNNNNNRLQTPMNQIQNNDDNAAAISSSTLTRRSDKYGESASEMIASARKAHEHAKSANPKGNNNNNNSNSGRETRKPAVPVFSNSATKRPLYASGSASDTRYSAFL